MNIHNHFYLNLFLKVSTDLLISKINKPAQPVIINNKKEWEVENIFDTKSYPKKHEFRIKWIGKDEDREYYKCFRFDNSPKIIQDFYDYYSNKLHSQTKIKIK